MVATAPYSFQQQSAVGTFGTTWDGLIQGVAMADPSYRVWLANGVLAQSETIPMWGGIAISEAVPPATDGAANLAQELGGNIIRATNISTTGAAGSVTGFSVFDQNYAAPNSPFSPVPLIGSGGQVNFYRLGSQARIPVKCAPGLVAADGNPITQQVSWDWTAQELIPYSPTYAQATITGAVWASTAGGQTTFTVSTDLTSNLGAGDIVEASGIVSTGGTGVGFNGQFIVVSVDSTHVVVTQAAAASPGTYSSGGHINAGGGALPVRILKIVPSNCMTVDYNPTTNTADWDRNGACALILI